MITKTEADVNCQRNVVSGLRICGFWMDFLIEALMERVMLQVPRGIRY